MYLGEPLGAHILIGGRIDERETDEEDVGLWVGERTQTIVVLLQLINRQSINNQSTINGQSMDNQSIRNQSNLSRRVPQSQIDRLTVDHYIGRVIVEAGILEKLYVYFPTIRTDLHCGYVFSGESIRCVADEKARFTDGSAR